MGDNGQATATSEKDRRHYIHQVEDAKCHDTMVLMIFTRPEAVQSAIQSFIGDVLAFRHPTKGSQTLSAECNKTIVDMVCLAR